MEILHSISTSPNFASTKKLAFFLETVATMLRLEGETDRQTEAETQRERQRERQRQTDRHRHTES